jgi:PAS domain S-box-containing protein
VETDFRALVESVQDYAIFTLDADGHVASWTPGAHKMKGYLAPEILGRHFSVFYTPDAIARRWPQYELQRAAAEGRFEDEGWRVRKDGTQFWANVVITAIYDAQHNLRGFGKVVRDMSERKRLAELEASSQRMSEFLAVLSHELRNPLAPVRNAISLMQMSLDMPPDLAGPLAMIDRQIQHLTRLVEDLLDVSRVTSGKVGLRLRNVALRDVVDRAAESARSELDTRAQHLDIRLPPEPVVFRGDLTRLVQVLHNLLLNASKFSPQGSTVTIEAESLGRLLEIRVTDQGCGIVDDALDEIFTLFVQHNPTRRDEHGGLGIGLSLCRSLVELHGGSIRASSPGIGQGSTFFVRLPSVRAETSDTLPAAQAFAQALRILVVDDNQDSADSLALLLQTLGHDVRAAYEGESALLLSQGFAPQLALVDLAMPVMDGFELRREARIRPEFAQTVFVAMTGYGQPGDIENTRKAGFDAHLVKPVELTSLEALLAGVMRTSPGASEITPDTNPGT